MGIKINQLPDLPAVTGTDMFPADNAGGTTGKHTLTKIANFAVNAFTLSLGGVTRTVKAAIDAFQTLLGSTDISDVGDGTLTGAVSALNSDLAKYVVGTWTPEIYDNTTKIGNAATHTYYRFGDVFICPFFIQTDLHNISTMLQIRGKPNGLSWWWGGSVYLNQASGVGNGGYITIQPSNVGVYFRPNITSANATSATSCNIMGVLIGGVRQY